MKKRGKAGNDRTGMHALANVKRFFPGVTMVEDGKKFLIIEVTKQDSNASVALDHKHCALAVACKRTTRADGVIIGVRTAYIINGHRAERYRLPESVSREIVSFDRHAGFAEGTYGLQAPANYERLGAYHKGKSANPPSGKKKPAMRHFTTNIRTMLGK